MLRAFQGFGPPTGAGPVQKEQRQLLKQMLDQPDVSWLSLGDVEECPLHAGNVLKQPC